MIRSRCIALLATGALFVGMLVTATAPPSFAVPKKTTPAPRYGATMAYDAAAGDVVLFGGQGVYDTHVGRQTWTWDGSRWTQRQPLHSPPARLDAGMVYDALDGQVVLFGGVGPASTRGDTWTWNGTDWTEQHPVHSPSPRRAMAMAYDAADGRVVLFGGEAAGNPALPTDTWTWDGSDWTQQHPAHSPGSRWFQGSAYDAATSRVLMFGGLDGTVERVNETWAWDGTDWSLLTPAHSPSPRSDLAMAEDSTRGYVLLYGGDSSTGGLGDTWTWDGTDWTPLSPVMSPSPLNDHSMADDPAAGQVAVFGGYESGGPLRPNSNTWTWDGTTWSKHGSGWISVSPRSGPPGTVVRVTGWSFTPAGAVKLRFIDSAGDHRFLGGFEADIDGRFSGTVKIPGNATPGKQFLQAVEQARECVTTRAFTVTSMRGSS